MPKANYDLPNETIQEVMRLSGAKSKREALVIAMEEYLRRKRVKELIDSFGTISLDWTRRSLKKYRR